MGLLQGEHPEIFARIGVGCVKSGFRRTNAVISLKRGKIRPRLLLKSNRKSYTGFRLVPKGQCQCQGHPRSLFLQYIDTVGLGQ